MSNSPSATAASSSAAAAAVDDYDSDGEAEPEESDDDLVVSSNDDDDDGDGTSNDDSSTSNEGIFFRAARDIQNRMSQNAGTAAMEDWLIMERITELADDLVSNVFCRRSHRPSSSHPPPSPPHRLSSRAGSAPTT